MGRAQLRAIYIGGAAAVGPAAAAALSFGAALDRICTNIGCMYETRDIDGAIALNSSVPPRNPITASIAIPSITPSCRLRRIAATLPG
jgi:hypothetical protein